jgi:single-stranded DNA-binding protein
MNDTNQITLSGRLTADPKIGIGKVKYAFYSIAINKQFKDYKKTTYVNVAAFSKEADYAEAFLRKGKKVNIVGELDVDKQGKLMVVANEQALRENVLYQRNQDKTNTEEKESESKKQYKPFTDIADDDSFTPVYPDGDEVPF